MGTLLLVHAHPDDESIATGGVMLKARAEGHRVVLVTATRGEVGEIHNMDEASIRPRLAEVRTEEMRRAGEILGINRQEFLGYRDSGMAGTADNDNPASFHGADLRQAAERVAAIIREERPDVVVTYTSDGTYGHPDHVKSHYVTVAAVDVVEAEGVAPEKLYFHAIPKSWMEQMAARAREAGQELPTDEPGMRLIGTPDEEITTSIDVREYVERKVAAFRAHVSQNAPNGFLDTMQGEILEAAMGTETFVLARGPKGEEKPERSLFAGL
ncbi:MAG: PIG-L family deacetylase [Actinomycetota bacterium]|nr:PIG-L family deacetylase [Candidatus Dormibacteraeota bacterium]MDQ6914545.1 PIG-L family deacetylase [Actinomycetota bacterium]